MDKFLDKILNFGDAGDGKYIFPGLLELFENWEDFVKQGLILHEK